MAEPHEVLGVAANADEATINAAFRRAAKRVHPDLNNGDASGIPRLGCLIAARDSLTGRKGRSSHGPKLGYHLPSARRHRITKSTVFAFVLAGAGSLLLLPAFAPYPARDPARVSAPAKTSLPRAAAIRLSSLDTEVSEAGSAEIEVIGAMQEAPPYLRIAMDADPLLQNGAKRKAASRRPASERPESEKQ